jgi:hypothetical protein
MCHVSIHQASQTASNEQQNKIPTMLAELHLQHKLYLVTINISHNPNLLPNLVVAQIHKIQ